MVKNKYWDFKNVIISAKAVVVSFITGLFLMLFVLVTRYFNQNEQVEIAAIILLLGVIFYFVTWGYLANRLWKWK